MRDARWQWIGDIREDWWWKLKLMLGCNAKEEEEKTRPSAKNLKIP